MSIHRPGEGRLVHVVTLVCKDAEHAERCLGALEQYGLPDAQAYGALSYRFGRKVGDPATVMLVEQWGDWDRLNALLADKVAPALPVYNELLAQPFDPARDTVRIEVTE